MLRLGITRDLPDLIDLEQRARERGIEIVPLPIMTVRHLPFEWPSGINGNGPDWVVFTSQHGVKAFFRRLSQIGISLPSSTQIAAVGARTAAALAQFGRTAAVLPDEPYGDQLFDLLLSRHVTANQRLIYARGAEVNFDPEQLFQEQRINYFPIICYETERQEIASSLSASLGPNDYMLFTAPSAVRAWHEQHGTPTGHSVAIGRTTAQTMTALGWSDIQTLPTPDVDTILEFLPWNE